MPTRSLSRSRRTASALVLLAGALLVPAAAFAQAQPSDVQLLRDFSHYVRIQQFELAQATAQQLLDRGLTPAEFVDLVETSPEAQRFEETIIRAQRQPQIEGVAAQMLAYYEQGKLDRARDPGSISRNIGLLTGTARQKQFARERLIAAGEYAAPQLLQALLQRNDMPLHAEVRRVFVDMRGHAVAPLTAALGGLDPSAQEIVVAVLGDLRQPAARPYLHEIWHTTPSDSLRTAVELAMVKIDGRFDRGLPVPGLFLALGEQYYAEPPSLTSFQGEEYQLLWTFDPGLGLVAQPILTEVYHEAMVMRCAERALKHDAGSASAVSLWLAANFSREIDSPMEYENPAYPPSRREAMYYAVAAGSTSAERVLARGLETRNTPLARRAIAAIEQTAGSQGLFTPGQDGRANALLDALRYPNRRVQYEAALAIASAQPRASFEGSDRVVPILASAVRDASARFAVVVAQRESQAAIADVLRGQGYTVLPPGQTLAEVQAAITDAPGVDVIVSDLPLAQTEQLIDAVRGTSRLSATPVLAMATLQAFGELSRKHSRDATLRIARAGLDDHQLANAVEQLLDVSVGGAITEDEALEYKIRSLAVLRDLAVSSNGVLNAADAAVPLIAALSNEQGEIKLHIAEVLSHMNAKRAQVAVMDAALQAQADERVAMLTIATASARRHGNMLEPRQVSRVIELAQNANGEEATAAAALMGALNLASDRIVPLILSAK